MLAAVTLAEAGKSKPPMRFRGRQSIFLRNHIKNWMCWKVWSGVAFQNSPSFSCALKSVFDAKAILVGYTIEAGKLLIQVAANFSIVVTAAWDQGFVSVW